MQQPTMLPIIISLAALGVAILSLIINVVQKQTENNRTLRNQLTDVMSKLATVAGEVGKLQAERESKGNTPFIQGRFINLNDQRNFLARQATALMSKIAKTVTDVEYATVAVAFRGIGDFGQADEYWRKAIEVSSSDFYRTQSLRGYANFLFVAGQHEAGREHYRQSLGVIRGDDDRACNMKGETLQRWALAEAGAGYIEEARRLLDQSRNTFRRVRSSAMRKHALDAQQAIEATVNKGLARISEPGPEKIVRSDN